MRARSIIIVLAVMAIGVGAIVGFGFFEQARGFRPESMKIFVEIREGRAEEVYDDSSALFKRETLQAGFLDLLSMLTQTLGPFVEVLEVVEVERNSSRYGKTARVALRLRFEAAETTGELSFHDSGDGVWRLLGFRVDIPESLEEKASALESEHERIKAPPEVMQLAEEILESVREGKSAEIYERTASQFKDSVSATKFEELMTGQEQALGGFVRILAVMSSAQNRTKNRARVDVFLEYQKAKTTGTFKFLKAGDEWRLVFFKVVIPEPIVPRPREE